jgi:hypothetical protein
VCEVTTRLLTFGAEGHLVVTVHKVRLVGGLVIAVNWLWVDRGL